MSRNTKIIATVGPVSCELEMLKKMINAGVNVFRLNCSHGDHDFHKRTAQFIRAAEQELNADVAIMMDLQGPKIRVGLFDEGSAVLKSGQKFIFDQNKELGNSNRVYVPNDELFQSVKRGNTILVDDGKILMQVCECKRDMLVLDVINGGVISNKKGINVPNVVLPINAITDKDKDDITIARDVTADFVAISFVQKASDLVLARRIINDINSDIKIVAKIEKKSAIDDLDAIMLQCDAIMVARGDLAVEVPFETVPTLQKLIVSKAIESRKPVIVATQMLESMTKCCTPTRAEINDVANAVFDNTDAIMLSAESASGNFPAESIMVMDRIASYNEQYKINTSDNCRCIAKCMRNIAVERDVDNIFVFADNVDILRDIASARLRKTVNAYVFDESHKKYACMMYGMRAAVCGKLYSFSQVIRIIQDFLSAARNNNDCDQSCSNDKGCKDCNDCYVLVLISINSVNTIHACKASELDNGIF